MQVYNTRRQRNAETVRIVDDELAVSKPVKRSDDKNKSFLRRHALSLSMIALAIAGSGLFLIYATHQDTVAAEKFETDQRASDAAFQKQIKNLAAKRIATAVKAEADAVADMSNFSLATYIPGARLAQKNCATSDLNSLTVVINKQHCFEPKDWKPSNLVDLDGFMVRSEEKPDLQAMMQAAADAGVNFELVSTYRTYQDQLELYSDHREVANGEDVDSTSARPGYSEHQTGLAIDVKIADCSLDCFGSTRRYKWLSENAATYGFIERYPAGMTEITGYTHEPWHWRYVGKGTALDMKKKNIKTLEMYTMTSGGDYIK